MRPEQAAFFDRQRCINCNSTEFHEISQGRFSDEPLARFIMEDPGGKDVLPYLQDATWSLVRCGQCGQVFHKRLLTDLWNEKRFSEWMSADAIQQFEDRLPTPATARKFKKARGYVEHVLRIEKLTRDVRGGEPVRLLDFGCGWGNFVLFCTGFGFDAVGVDRSTPRAEGASVQVFPSIESLGQRSKFHAITLFETLEHLNEPSPVLKSLSELIVPGGVLVLETPNCSGATDIRSLSDYRKLHPLEHINAFTHETLRSIAERNGFRIIGRPIVHVTADRARVLKRELRYLSRRDGRSTQLYFRRSA